MNTYLTARISRHGVSEYLVAGTGTGRVIEKEATAETGMRMTDPGIFAPIAERDVYRFKADLIRVRRESYVSNHSERSE